MIRLFVRNAPTVLLLVLTILIFGAQSYKNLPRESFPDIEIPVVLVTTPYIGVSPVDIETLVTFPIENELAGVADLKKMSSTSAEGISIVSLEFEPEADIEGALQKVRDGVNRAKRELPDDAEEPSVREVSFDDFPIMIISIAGDRDEEELKHLAEDLQDDLDRIDGVLDVKIAGGLERQMRIQVDPVRLASYGLSLSDVVNAVRNENVNIPGGEVRSSSSTFLVRVPGEFEAGRDLENVAIKRMGDRPVFIRDVARVIDGYADRSTYARMNGQASISVSITKRAGANILEIAEQAKAVAATHAEGWPGGVEHQVLGDQSKNIALMVSELENNILTALLLVVAVLVFSLGARTSLFVAAAIPLSMLASFALLDFFGMTLNMVVLFSLILALGMLVDNGIVIVENIYRHAEEGKDIVTASIDGTREVALAVAASTATTVAAFFPLVFWTGIMGQFMGFLPKTIIIVLISSLVVALVILPVATAKLMSARKSGDSGVDFDAERELTVPETTGIMDLYKRVLQLAIRHRYKSAVLGVVSLFATFVAYGALNHGTEFFPNMEPDRATIAVRLPDGTDIETTDRVLRRIEGMLAEEGNIETFVAESGVSGGGNPMAGAQAASNQGKVTIDFPPHRNNARDGDPPRIESTFLTIDRIREKVSVIPGAEIVVDQERGGPPVGAPIGVEVSGEAFHEVGQVAFEVQRALAAIPGVTDLTDDYRVGRPEMRLRIDRGAAKRVGASTVGVANDVRTAIAGTVASTLKDGTDEYDIVVEVDPRYTEDLQGVLALRIAGREDTSPQTFAVPLSSVASYDLIGGSGSIRHIDQKLVVSIEGDIVPGFNENAVREAIADKLAELDAAGTMPAGVTLRLGGADDEQRAAQEFLGRAFMMALALIAIVLVSQFNRFSTMFIILGTVMLSLIGVLWGLIITGTPFGIIMTGLGVISLAGVVVNNAIVLIDYINQLRDRGMDRWDAVVKAGLTRFRPVMLTAITTVLGLVPMAIGLTIDFGRGRVLLGGSSANWWGPMAIAVIFGLSFATILTLVFVPTLYSIREDLGDRFAALWARFGPNRTAAAATISTTAKVLVGLVLLGAAASSAQAAPVTLDEAWTAAEQDNVDLLMLNEQVIQAESQRGQVMAMMAPRLTANATYTFNQFETALDFSEFIPDEFAEFFEGGGDPILIQKKRQFGANLNLVQPIYNGEAVPLLSAAFNNLEAVQLDEKAQTQKLRAAVTAAFYGLAVARQGDALAARAVETAENHLQLAQRQADAGLAPRRALVQAQLSLSQAQRERAAAATRTIDAEEGFAQATGLPRDSEPILPERALEPPVSVDAAVADALNDRPDLEASEYREVVASVQHTSRLLGFLPVIDARFTESYSEVGGFTGENWNWMIVLQANWTLWDGGRRVAQLKADKSNVRLAELATRKLQNQAVEEVRVAWEELKRAELAMTAVQDEIALAEENLVLAERGFEAGTVTWLEVSDATLGLERARLMALQERMGRDLAAVQLQVATGTL